MLFFGKKYSIDMNSIQIKILGCGSSWGVPVIGCKCSVCISDRSENKRTRSSILIQNSNTKVLVDCGFDTRNQLIREDVRRIDAVILTHDHADHVCGIDDLRVFKDLHKSLPKFYTDHQTFKAIHNKYGYLFERGVFDTRQVDFEDKVKVGDIEIQLFKQDHGTMNSLGLRIGDVIYTNDVIRYPEESKKYLYNARVWIVDCVDYRSTKTHVGLPEVLDWKKEFKPKQMFLTNMSHDIDYFEIIKSLPEGVLPSYDGMVIEVVI
jgi:phosphoribosyl 1,2-cyclic phosphate phosphodiesterase